MPTRHWFSRILFTIIVLFLTSVPLPSPVRAQQGEDEEHREVPGLDVIMVIDESETMWNQTDTNGVRVNTVNLFIDMLSSEQSGAVHRLGIVAFGTEPTVIPYTLLDSQAAAEDLKAQYASVHQRIQFRKNSQYTDINKALHAALAMIEEQSDPDRKSAIVLVSDGQPTAAQVSEEKSRDTVVAYLDETRGLLEQLRDYPYEHIICPSPKGAPLYMVGIGVDKLAESSSPDFIALYREFWQGAASRAGGYYKEAGQVQEMQGISTYIFSELLCTPATPSLGVHSPQVLEYQVHDSYFQILFTISGKENPETQAKIYRPQEDGTAGGAVLRKDEQGVNWQSNGIDYEVWGVKYNEPWTGTWRVVLEGEGRADFSYVFFPNVTINLYEPNGSFLSADKPFTIRAGILDETGQPVDIPVKDFQVEIEGQGGFRKQVTLEKDGDTFVARLEPMEQTGEYSLTLHAVLPDGTPLYEHRWVTLISAPWVEVTEPIRLASYAPGEAIPLQARVHLAGATSFEDIKLIATLSRDGQSIQTVEMSRGDTVSEAGENVVAYSGSFSPPSIPPASGGEDVPGAPASGGEEASGAPAGGGEEASGAPAGGGEEASGAPAGGGEEASDAPTSGGEEIGWEYTVQAEMMAILPGGRVFDHETAPIPLIIVMPVTPTPSPTPSPTSTPIPTPTPTTVIVETPTPTPTLVPLLTLVSSSPLCLPAILALLFLALLLTLMVLRKRRRTVPGKIKLLAELMRSRRESGESPYILVLGSGTSVTLGSRAMRRVLKAIAGGDNLDRFYKTLDGLSPLERYVILNKHFAKAGMSPGYRRLAELIEEGFFNIVFTTNLDPSLEQALSPERAQDQVDFEILTCGDQSSTETMNRLESGRPRIKIVKLHGDVPSRSFAFTPSEISLLGGKGERVLRHYLSRDTIIVGHGPRDYDINRAVEREGGSIWYIGQNPPPVADPIYQAMRARGTQTNLISGEFGMFDRFFKALHRELMRS